MLRRGCDSFVIGAGAVLPPRQSRAIGTWGLGMQVGFLHPGEMGAALAAVVAAAGHRVLWAGAGRSPQTHARAAAAGLEDAGSVRDLARRCDLLMAVCPPHAALALARVVAATGFAGLYVDANAIAPSTVQAVRSALVEGGCHSFVDAAVVGPPPSAAPPSARAVTQLLLSGPARAQVAALFDPGSVTLVDLGDEAGRASALKLCHSAWHKSLLALQASTWALADRWQLLADFDQLLTRRGETAATRRTDAARRLAAKAWRFAGEMHELATMLDDAGLPATMAQGAAAVFERSAQADADRLAREPWAALAQPGAPR